MQVNHPAVRVRTSGLSVVSQVCPWFVQSSSSHLLLGTVTGEAEGNAEWIESRQVEGVLVRHTVLLVEDSHTIRHILKISLMTLTRDFLDATGAEEGLQLLETHRVDLVIADVNMPGGMDGLEFVRRARASERELVRRLPIVLLTGGKAPDLEVRGLRAGASEF